MSGLELLSLAALCLIAIGIAEKWLHRRRLVRIPLRLHVSGTRGKSSVTRLIAAGLRHAGLPTAAKTTGTLARMILPNTKEIPVFRPAGPNILEQIRIINTAESLGVQAIVLECMALQPELHWISEHQLIRATHGVITNIRADHLDVMGPTEADVARAIAGMIPVGGVLITGERTHLDILRYAAEDRGTRLVTVTEEDLAAVTDEDLSRFSYLEHRENVALSLKVLQELKIDREVAMQGMWKASPDPGALVDFEVDFFGRQIFFVNGFAANDPQSTETIWRVAKERHPAVEQTIAVFNLRADRPSRTQQLARETTFWQDADHIVLMGTGAYLFARVASQRGMDSGRFIYAEQDQADEIFETIVGLCGRSNLIVGIANIAGLGLDLVRYFHNRRILPEGKP
jgi:poly-gamma-glutamate synthase PgsB/CapB